MMFRDEGLPFLAVMVAIGLFCCSSSARADTAAEVLAMTGARTKIVWLHGVQGKGNGWDAISADYELVGFDTDDGRIRTILPGPASYANPCISPDGEQVLYTDTRNNTLYAVKWDGTDKRELTKGYVLCTWKHPVDGTEWVYFTRNGYSNGPLERCRLDDPTRRETLWTGDQVAHTMTISADGTHIGTEFPWPRAGVGVLPDNGWRQYGTGCNGCIAPDNSYRFFHMGEEIGHDGIVFYDDGGTNRRIIRFKGDLPSDAWIPRWSTHTRFLTTNSPIGGSAASIYLGKFNEGYSKVERWIRISTAAGQNTKAYAWIDLGLGQYAGEAPLSVNVPQTLTPGTWTWDYGDGSTDQTGTHVYSTPGSYTMTARNGDRMLKGWVTVQPRKAPRVTTVQLLDEAHLQLSFDERVQLQDAGVAFKSKLPVANVTLDSDGLNLLVELKGRLGTKDSVTLKGISDRAQQPNPLASIPIPVARPAWPVNRTGLVFAWQTASTQHIFYHGSSRSFRQAQLVGSGAARLDRNGAMLLTGGYFTVVDAGTGIANACQTANACSIEATITPANTYQGYANHPRRILGCNREGGDLENVNFALGQEGNKLILFIRLRPIGSRDANGKVQRVELCTLEDRAANHVVVSYTPDKLVCVLNGKVLPDVAALTGELCWQRTAFGDGLHFGGRGGVRFPWRGILEGVAIYARAATAEEAAADYAASARLRAARPSLPQIALRAILIAQSEVPSVADIAPYRDALVVNEYEVLALSKGKYAPKRLRVAQWGLQDGQPTQLARAKIGDTTELLVESFDAHKEVGAEVLRDTLPDDLDLALYLDVTLQPSGAPRLADLVVHPAEVWLSPGMSTTFNTEQLDQYGNPIRAEVRWSVAGGGQVDRGTGYGVGAYFEECKHAGDGLIDAAGQFTGTKPGVLTITANGVTDPSVKATATVGCGRYPAITPAKQAPLRIGTDNGDDHAYTGDIDRVRIYSRPLTSEEIRRHAVGQGIDIAAEGLVADWTFDELHDEGYANIAGTGLLARVVGKVQHVDDAAGRYVHLTGRGYLEVAKDARLDISQTATLECWIRPSAQANGYVISKSLVWSYGVSLEVNAAGGGSCTLDAVRLNSGALVAKSPLPQDTWTHIVAVLYGGGAQRIYINGECKAELPPRVQVIRE